VAPEGPDGGIDILAHEDELGFKPPIIKVQVKSTTGSIGNDVVTALYGHVKPGEYGLLVTLGVFTNQARTNSKTSQGMLRSRSSRQASGNTERAGFLRPFPSCVGRQQSTAKRLNLDAELAAKDSQSSDRESEERQRRAAVRGRGCG
jgi:hypothetical protein